jgi:hypothetical protein
MKKITSIFFLLFSLVNLQSFAQTTTLSEGVIKMEITDVSSDNEQVAAQMQMLNGTQTAYYFNSEKSMVSADMMGGMIKIKSLVNNANENMTMLFDAMGQKMMIESTKEDRKEMEDAQVEASEGFNVNYDESDTKEILGYKCVKATITNEENPGMEFIMYVAPSIKASNKLIQGMSAYELRGFPLEYTMTMPEMSLTTTAVSLEKSVPAGTFDLNTSGYTKMTFKEFTDQMQGFGGMGF